MPKKNTKARIVETAKKMFNEKSSQAVTTHHIANEIGISPGNLYYHFKNKEEIIREILDLRAIDTLKAWNNNHKASFKRFLKMLNVVNIVLWDYRFMLRELHVLMKNDLEFERKFRTSRDQRIKAIDSFLQKLIDAEVLTGLDNHQTKSALIKVLFILVQGWTNNLETEGKTVNKKSIQECLPVILMMFKPYLKKREYDELSEELKCSIF